MPDNKPVHTFNEGLVKVAIFFNQSELGGFFNTIFSKLYKTSQNGWANSQNFAEYDLATLAACVQRAYAWIQDHKQTGIMELKLPLHHGVDDIEEHEQ